MRIVTWNVNGYRAILKKGFQDWFQAIQPDILCLQEIKSTPDQLTDEQKTIAGYDIFWNPAQKLGYSGVASIFKTTPDNVIIGMGNERYDFEGRVILSKQDGFNLFNVYFPNGQRGQDRVDFKLDFYKDLLQLVNELRSQGEEVIITGDFNTAHNEIDLANPKENQKTSGFLPEERVWVDEYLKTGLIDIYREKYPDKVQYTWWTYITNARARNVGWRIDYYLITPGLLTRIEDVIIHDQAMGSDHCPVELLLN